MFLQKAEVIVDPVCAEQIKTRMGLFLATWKYLKSNLQKRRFDLSPGQTDLAFDRLRHRDITLLSAFRGKELF